MAIFNSYVKLPEGNQRVPIITSPVKNDFSSLRPRRSLWHRHGGWGTQFNDSVVLGGFSPFSVVKIHQNTHMFEKVIQYWLLVDIVTSYLEFIELIYLSRLVTIGWLCFFLIPTSWDIVSVVNIWAVDPRSNRIQREHEMIRWPLSSRHLQGREVARGVACFARFDVAANGRGRREPLGAWRARGSHLPLNQLGSHLPLNQVGRSCFRGKCDPGLGANVTPHFVWEAQ